MAQLQRKDQVQRGQEGLEITQHVRGRCRPELRPRVQPGSLSLHERSGEARALPSEETTESETGFCHFWLQGATVSRASGQLGQKGQSLHQLPSSSSVGSPGLWLRPGKR